MSIERHYFPGNNTPEGFFSYYKYILGQREANRIICLKGGPGTGKSTFMKRIAEIFRGKEDIDYLHCSADENSLDGIVLKNRKVALIDGTSPHLTDPLTPGAVDKLLNLGEFWNEESISINKDEIIDLNEETSKWYRVAYNYLNAAKSVFRSLESIYSEAVESSEVYKVVADVINDVYGNNDISLVPGKKKKFFASAVTASGVVNYIPSLLENMNKIYMVSAPVGYSNNSFMEIIAEGALYRGLQVEAYYCSICPDEKIEHLVIPEIGTAFVTMNDYHDFEPWEIDDFDELDREIVLIDVSDYMKPCVLLKNKELLDNLKEEYEILIGKSCKYLEKAKSTHMKVEDMYIPSMNFTEVGNLIAETAEELEAIL